MIRNPGIGGGFAYLVSTQNQVETRVSTSSIACESFILMTFQWKKKIFVFYISNQIFTFSGIHGCHNNYNEHKQSNNNEHKHSKPNACDQHKQRQRHQHKQLEQPDQ